MVCYHIACTMSLSLISFHFYLAGTYELTPESTISNGEIEHCMIVTGSCEDPPLYIVAANHRIKQDWEKAIKGEIERIRTEFNEHTAMLDPLPVHKALQLLEHNKIHTKFTRLLVMHQNPFVKETCKTDKTQTRYQLLVRGDNDTWSRERLYIMQGKGSHFQKITLKEQIVAESVSADAATKAKDPSRKESEAAWAGQSSPRVKIIFKVGDDLRQDALVLQSLRLFQHLWEDEGLMAPLTPYPAVSTWTDGGMIGVVPDSATLADIQSEYVVLCLQMTHG